MTSIEYDRLLIGTNQDNIMAKTCQKLECLFVYIYIYVCDCVCVYSSIPVHPAA